MTAKAKKPCKICLHPKRKQIEAALADAEQSTRSIAKTHGVCARTLDRHRLDCTPELIAKAVARTEGLDDSGSAAKALGADLVYQMNALQAHTLAILEAAKDDPKTQLAAVMNVRHNITLIARLTGKLDGGDKSADSQQITYEQFTAIYNARVLNKGKQ